MATSEPQPSHANPPSGLDEMPAGVHSVKQSISHEPSFTRKRRVHDSDSQIVHEGILRHGGESTAMNNENNPALLFKAGQRRPLPAAIPTEYQLQFTWKSGSPSEGPLLSAERLISNRGAGKKKEGGGVSGASGGVKERGGRKEGGGEARGKERGGRRGGKVGGGEEGGTGRKGKKTEGENAEVRLPTDSRTSPLRGVKKPRFNGTALPRGSSKLRGGSRLPSTKLPRRKSQSRHRCSRGKKSFTGQSEYRAQYRAWPISSESVSHGKRHMKIHSPKKRSDITDPRLATPPPLPNSLPGPLKSDLWGTEYSTRFKSPLNFQYVRGAWMETPQPTPIPKSSERPLAHENTPSESESENDEEEEKEEDEQPIRPQESLLAQLSEIRRKADEYRQRSESCHFSPSDSTWAAERQLNPETKVATQSHTPSVSLSHSLSHSSSVSLNDEPTNQNAQPFPSHEQPSQPHSSLHHTLANGGLRLESVEGEGVEEEREGVEEGEGGGSGGTDTQISIHEDGEKAAHSDENINHETGGGHQMKKHRSQGDRTKMNGGKFHTISSLPPPADPDGDNGRVPTPVLRETSEQMRHHLDRTTPTSGSILTSPPLPAFLRQLRTATSSKTAGRTTGKQPKVGVRTCTSSSKSAGVSREGKTASKPWSSGLYLSHGSPKLKRDPSLVSSVTGDPRSSSHRPTLPKSITSHPSKVHPSHLSTLPPSTHHRLMTHPSPPPSMISSLFSTTSDPSSTGAVKKLDYGTSSRAKTANAVRFPQSEHSHPHTHVGATSIRCDICGAWLQKSQGLSTCTQHARTNGYLRTDMQRSHASQGVNSSTHQYRGPVTQLSRPHSFASHMGAHSTPQESNSNILPEPQPKGTTSPVPPQKQTPPFKEADELSISSLSLSGCSVASDLLKKARERREKFWTQPPPHTTS